MQTASANPAARAISFVRSRCSWLISAGTPITVSPPRTAAGCTSLTAWQTLPRNARASVRARSDRAISGLKPQAMRRPACSSLSYWLQVSSATVPNASTVSPPPGPAPHSTHVAVGDFPPIFIGTAASAPSPWSLQ